MKGDKMSDLDKKINTAFAQLATVGDFLLGSVRLTRAKYIKKDGTVSYHKAQPVFTYTDAETGKQKKIRIREECFGRVKQLIENGKNYRKAERRLCALMLVRNLSDAVKKNVRNSRGR
jgi:hypothetical protein